MKNYSDRQKYRIIIWYYFLKDLKEYNVEEVINDHYPGYKLNLEAMSDRISWGADNAYARNDIYPWILQTKNQEGVILHLPFECLCDP